ncbi:MAG: anthranilate synthase component I family protein [Bacteroidia bacterium]
MRASITFLPENSSDFLKKLIFWAENSECFCFLDKNKSQIRFAGYGGFQTIVGVGKHSEVKNNSTEENGFSLLKSFIHEKNDTLFGFLNYDLKNHTEKLSSENYDGIEMLSLHFFQPEIIFRFSDTDEIEIGYFTDSKSENEIIDLTRTIENIVLEKEKEVAEIHLNCRVSKDEYVENVRKIKEHIQLGDVYELNYCIEFFAENAEVNPAQVYQKLNKISSAPFSCFYKIDNKYLICASPERFLKKEGEKIIAQPMKGTAKRSSQFQEDQLIKDELFANEKERAENVMIVDLVRNDLSKTAVKQSVKVDELFGIYSFPQVHQMVSTVSSEMRNDVDIIDVIKSAFPMGSMTGAPKVKAMELIEEFEITKRGLFSGAVGYITEDKSFDFNVVIRSIQYNAEKKYLSFMVGSAITINSDPEKEYEECLLKAQALIEALN